MTVKAFQPEHKTNAQRVVDLHTLGYLPEPVLDPTFGTGGMWIEHRPVQLTSNDLYVHSPEVQYHHDYIDLPRSWRGVFGSCLFDPPYKLNGTPTNVGGMDDRYGTGNGYRPISLVRYDIEQGMEECADCLRPGGYLIVKCMDQISSGQFQPQTFWVARHAERYGWDVVDLLHLSGGREQPAGRRQVHARRNYSTFVVLRVPLPRQVSRQNKS